MLRIAIYARVSTADKGQGPENQLRELRQFVANKSAEGWTLAGEYVDHVTGKTANRPEFQRLFRDAAERKFDLVLFWSLDRFTREGVLETLQHLQRLTGPFRDAVLSILATIAQQREGSPFAAWSTRGWTGRGRRRRQSAGPRSLLTAPKSWNLSGSEPAGHQPEARRLQGERRARIIAERAAS